MLTSNNVPVSLSTSSQWYMCIVSVLFMYICVFDFVILLILLLHCTIVCRLEFHIKIASLKENNEKIKLLHTMLQFCNTFSTVF